MKREGRQTQRDRQTKGHRETETETHPQRKGGERTFLYTFASYGRQCIGSHIGDEQTAPTRSHS